MLFRRITFALIVCGWVPAMSQAKDVAKLIPADALGYVVINHLADIDGRIHALGKRMKLPLPSIVSTVKTQSGIAQGIDEFGSIALAFFPTTQGPSAVLYVPIDDYVAFIEQLKPVGTENGITTGRFVGRPVIVAKKASHAVFAWPTNRALLQKVLSDEVTGQGPIDIATTLTDDHDVAAVLSSEGVKTLTELGQKGLKEAKEVMRKQFDEDNPALEGIEVYVQFLHAISSEVESAAVGLKLDKGGSVRVDEWVWVQPNGKIAPILRDAQPYNGDMLSGLPKMPYVVAFGGILPDGALQPMMEFSRNLMKAMPQLYGLTPDQVDKMMDLSVKYFSDVRGMSFLVGIGQGDAPLYSEMLGAMHVRDAKAFVNNYREYWKELDNVIGDAEGSFLNDVKVEDVKSDGVTALKISMPIPGIQQFDLPNKGEIEALMEKLYGPGGVTVYLAAADDNNTVFMAYTEMALLGKALQATGNKTQQLSQDENVASTSKHLPPGAHMVGYWSPGGTIAFANRIMRLVSGAETGFQLPAFPDTPPVGWAMRATHSVVRFNTVLPSETIEATGSFVAKLRQLDGVQPLSD